MLNFILFGFGMALPLILLGVLGSSQTIINYLTTHKRKINLIAGIIMLAISLYYLIFVFGMVLA